MTSDHPTIRSHPGAPEAALPEGCAAWHGFVAGTMQPIAASTAKAAQLTADGELGHLRHVSMSWRQEVGVSPHPGPFLQRTGDVSLSAPVKVILHIALHYALFLMHEPATEATGLQRVGSSTNHPLPVREEWVWATLGSVSGVGASLDITNLMDRFRGHVAIEMHGTRATLSIDAQSPDELILSCTADGMARTRRVAITETQTPHALRRVARQAEVNARQIHSERGTQAGSALPLPVSCVQIRNVIAAIEESLNNAGAVIRVAATPLPASAAPEASIESGQSSTSIHQKGRGH